MQQAISDVQTEVRALMGMRAAEQEAAHEAHEARQQKVAKYRGEIAQAFDTLTETRFECQRLTEEYHSIESAGGAVADWLQHMQGRPRSFTPMWSTLNQWPARRTTRVVGCQ